MENNYFLLCPFLIPSPLAARTFLTSRWKQLRRFIHATVNKKRPNWNVTT